MFSLHSHYQYKYSTRHHIGPDSSNCLGTIPIASATIADADGGSSAARDN